MDRETFEQQKAFAGGKMASMKRRCLDHDYTERRMYMVTLVTEGRRKLFGEVQGRSDAPKGSAEAPHIVLSELGKTVERIWLTIADYHPEIKVLSLQMMPDHLHCILFVQRKMEKPLGAVILGVKQSCNKAYREAVGCVAVTRQHTQPKIEKHTQPEIEQHTQPKIEQHTQPKIEQHTQPEIEQHTQPEIEQHTQPEIEQHTQPEIRQQTQHEATEQPTQPKEEKHTGHEKGLFFERGYNDRILLQDGQLQHWIDYLADNPRRLLAKREHPDLFRVNFGIQYGGQTYAAIGNRFLLQHPYKLQVQCSRKLTANEIQVTVDHFVGEARRGAVLVSPALSPGEKAVMRAALDAQMPTIYLSPTSFSPYTKPGGAFTEACARGHFLILAPWSDRPSTQPIKRSECLMLNDMTKEIVNSLES